MGDLMFENTFASHHEKKIVAGRHDNVHVRDIATSDWLGLIIAPRIRLCSRVVLDRQLLCSVEYDRLYTKVQDHLCSISNKD